MTIERACGELISAMKNDGGTVTDAYIIKIRALELAKAADAEALNRVEKRDSKIENLIALEH
jgi:hypothetical protein